MKPSKEAIAAAIGLLEREAVSHTENAESIRNSKASLNPNVVDHAELDAMGRWLDARASQYNEAADYLRWVERRADET